MSLLDYAKQLVSAGATPDSNAELFVSAPDHNDNIHGVDITDDDLPENLRPAPNRFREAQAAKNFVLAGNAYFTLRSVKTGVRYTFRVSRPKDEVQNQQGNLPWVGARWSDERTPTFFVGLLTGPENSSDYTYIGIVRGGEFRLTRKSRMSSESAPVKAFGFFWRCLQANVLHQDLEVWHEGRCGRCGRRLTVPESIAAGIGPECAGRL